MSVEEQVKNLRREFREINNFPRNLEFSDFFDKLKSYIEWLESSLLTERKKVRQLTIDLNDTHKKLSAWLQD
jgi:hypothetical protein